MKKFTKSIKLLAIVAAFFCAKVSYSQCNANFVWTIGANGAVTFTSTSTPTTAMTSYYWQFGNSTQSIVAAPNNTAATNYPANGVYTVMLFYGTGTCSTSVIYTLAITNVSTPTCNLNANFNTYPSGNGFVGFANNSTGTVSATSYTWNWGDGTPNSNANTPSHTYTTNGTYVITLTADNNFTPACVSTYTAAITITNVAPPSPCNLNANFSYTQNNGVVSFNNTSTGTVSGTTYFWQFGGSTATSTLHSPMHTFTANGTYTVALFATNSSTCSSQNVITIVVNSICSLNANFSYTQGSNGLVNFLNSTTGTVLGTYYTWNFGDGGVSGSPSPAHTYTANGTYTVLLGAHNASVNPACHDTITQVITITSATCTANSGFTLVPSGTPQYWFAIPSVTANIANAIWSWGDGSTSTGLFSNHTYSAAGNYTICLSVTVTCGANSTTCFNYAISKSADDNSIITVNVKTAEQIAAGIEKNTVENSYNVSPNPNNGSFNIRMNGINAAKAEISVYSILGELVYQSNTDVSGGAIDKNVDLEKITTGVYFVKVNVNDKVYTKKLIINK